MRMFQTWLWGCPRVRPFVSDAVLIDSVLSPLGGAVRRRVHRFTSPLRSGPASSGRIQSGASLAIPDADDPGTRAGPAIGRLPTARGSARPAPALYWLAGPIVKLVAGNKPWSGPRSYCWRSRASRRRAIPRRPSSSIATSGRSSRTIVISATGPTRPSARPTCGWIRSRRPRPIATAAARSCRATSSASELYRRITAEDARRADAAAEVGEEPLTAPRSRRSAAGSPRGQSGSRTGRSSRRSARRFPGSSDRDWVRNPIDAFILARLEREGLAPAPEAERGILIRRVTLDLTGLPPTLAEVDAFEHDSAPDAYERVVDRLLSSPRFGERMASPLAQRGPLRRHQRLSDRRRRASCGDGATG